MNEMKKRKRRPVGRPRADGRSHLTKIDVFRTSAKLMSVFGYTGTSVRMIAQELDCTTASIFNLFPTKKELFDELISFVAETPIEFYEELRALEPPAAEALFKSLIEDSKILNSAPVEFIALFEMPELRHPDFGHARNLRRRLVSHYDIIITNGIDQGDFYNCNARWMAEQMIQLIETCIMAGDQYTRATREQRSLETARFGLRGLLVDPTRLSEIEEASAKIDVTYKLRELA